MDQELIARIRATLSDRLTEELRALYTSGDRAIWSLEALEAMRQILIARSETGLAPLSAPVAPLPVPTHSPPIRPYLMFRVVAGAVMVVATIVLIINLGIVFVGETRGVTAGSWLLLIVYVVLPPLLIFCIGAIVYLLTEVASKLKP